VTDDLVPLPPQIQGIPSPRDVSTMLISNLAVRVHYARTARGDVTQPEDVNALVRALGGAKEMLDEYSRAFATAAREAVHYLEEELLFAVGEQDGVPLSGLKVPDLDGTDLVFTLMKPKTHTVDEPQVIDVAVVDALAAARDTEPAQEPDESNAAYLDRYERWMAGVVHMAVNTVIGLGSYSMQVSKVRAYAVELAGRGADTLASVVRGSITTKDKYTGTKFERKERKSK